VQNLIKRTILWFVAVPALIAIILLLPYQNHLALNVIVVIASALGATELAGLFQRRDTGYRASFVTIPLLGAAIPLAQLLVLNGVLRQETVQVVLLTIAGVILLLQVFRREDEGFSFTLSNIGANITLLIYPGLFLAYVVRLSEFDRDGVYILVFLCTVFFNDTLAYLSGMLYRSMRGRIAERAGRTWEPKIVFPVSPRKTIVGFAGGLLASPVTLLIAKALFPQRITAGTVTLVLAGLAVGVATIFGDLIESALKRGATSKDSGTLVPGRGGILDSIDSILYAAPVFYYLFRYIL
jgi:phosphatidate cytidylyltransferase